MFSLISRFYGYAAMDIVYDDDIGLPILSYLDIINIIVIKCI